jgi:2-oxoglutarate ferredoxin oxidoreductase subunit alpha
MNSIKLMQGSEACCEGAFAAGVRFFAGYPITPATEIVEKMAEHLPKIGGKFIQMEDELASMGAACGASLAGVKSITATSGPGFSLKQEMIGYAAMTEIPITIINVQRLGPSTGNIFAGQGDVMQSKWGSSGDRSAIAISPSSVRECFELTVQAVNWSEQYRTPVVLLLDETIAHMRQTVTLPDPNKITIVNRKQPSGDPESFEPYRPGTDGIPEMAVYGSRYYSHITGLVHDYRGIKSNESSVADELIWRLISKIDNAANDLLLYKTYMAEDAEVLFVSFGCSAMACHRAVKVARVQKIKAGLLTLQTIWPFPSQLIQKFSEHVKKIFVVEMNAGQLAGLVKRYVDSQKVVSVPRVNGELFKPDELVEIIQAQTRGEK